MVDFIQESQCKDMEHPHSITVCITLTCSCKSQCIFTTYDNHAIFSEGRKDKMEFLS